MLDYKILDYKSIITDKDTNEQYLDLASTSFNINIMPTGSYLMVNEMYIGRPDLISLAVYGSDEYADIICKVNGISNPFELNSEMLIFLPTLDYISQCCKHYNETPDIIKEEDDTSISSRITSFQKKVDDIRAPHEQTEGYVNYVYDKNTGLLIY